ncbi:MAG: CDP-glycerol glycerophosphotransferase family protein [Bacteroidales bacterium]|nr:CDP-glycerol glycerophosphotransferase family protein [Bacteroidales bacterium]
MEAIIITRNLSEIEISEIATIAGNDMLIYASTEQNLPFKFLQFPELSAEEKRNINFSTMKTVLGFGERKLENEPITELLMQDTASPWHYHKFRIYFTLRNMKYEAESVRNLASKHKTIKLFTSYPTLNILLEDEPGIIAIPGKSKNAAVNSGNMLRFGTFFVLRGFLGIFQYFKVRKKRHLIIDHALKQQCLDFHTLEPIEGNYNLQYLFDKLGNEFVILDDTEIPKPTAREKFKPGSQFYGIGKNKLFGEFVLLIGLLSGRVRNSLSTFSSNLKLAYLEIENNLESKDHKVILQQLKSLHSSTRLFLFKYLSYRRFLQNLKFKSITTIDENSARIKSILDAAKYHGIKTIGIQHGTIHELHPAYLFTNTDNELSIPCDHTMVWGDHWANFLEQTGNYPKSSLITTGQIRTDIIPKLIETKGLTIPGIENDKKIIVFASQPQRDPVIRKKAAWDVFTAVKDMQDIQLILKLHPAEKNDENYYREIAKEAQCKNYRIIHKVDLYLLISLSDVMVTCFSTVGAETVYFNKPLIILDHLRQDIQGYHKAGIAKQATNAEELQNLLSGFLKNKISVNKEAYTSYIEKYAYRIDGHVADRILSFLHQIE